MARARAFDDAEAVRAAREVFWAQGYEHTSLIDLQRATGLSRSSLYSAYGSKRSLFQRASLDYLAEVVDPMLAPMEAPGADRGTVAGFFLSVAGVLRSPDTRFAGRGCFVLNTILELEQLDAEAVDMVTSYRSRVHAALTHALGSIDDEDTRRARAEVLTSAHVGIMISARVDPRSAAVASETIAAEYIGEPPVEP